MAKVGVILNHKEELSSLMEGEQIDIYECQNSKWIKIKEIKQAFPENVSVKETHDFIDKLVDQLDECKILIGTAITGIPFMILDKQGLILCEADEMSEELLNEVDKDYGKPSNKSTSYEETNIAPMKEQEEGATMFTFPFETEIIGVYELDMIELQKVHPNISSKKALIPFLRETEFHKLNIYCNHVMPWLDIELPIRKLKYHEEFVEGKGYRIIIEHV